MAYSFFMECSLVHTACKSKILHVLCCLNLATFLIKTNIYVYILLIELDLIALCRPQNIASDGCGLFSVLVALLWTGVLPHVPLPSSVQLYQVTDCSGVCVVTCSCLLCVVAFNKGRCSCSLE